MSATAVWDAGVCMLLLALAAVGWLTMAKGCKHSGGEFYLVLPHPGGSMVPLPSARDSCSTVPSSALFGCPSAELITRVQ